MREVGHDLDWRTQMADKRRDEDEPKKPAQPQPERPDPSKPPVKPEGDVDQPGRQDPSPPHP